MSETRSVKTAYGSGAAPLRTPGATKLKPAVRRFEQRIALFMVILPTVGFAAALTLLWTSGIGWLEVGLLIGMYIVGALGIEVGFHRLFTHRSFETSEPIRILLAIFGSMNAQGPVLFWAAIHRRHHQFSDRMGDPHSPHVSPHGSSIGNVVRGLWHAHVGWLFDHEVTDWGRYVPDLLRDKVLFKINRHYFVWPMLGVAIPTLLGGLLTGTWMGALKGFLWGGMVRIFLAQHVTWAVNSLGHVYGSRPFQIEDRSGNNGWLALLSAGGSWHNNHHAFPTSAWHGLKWWQIDPAGWFINTLVITGLAEKLELPTPEMITMKLAENRAKGQSA